MTRTELSRGADVIADRGAAPSLTVRFSVVTALILQVGMVVLGEWVSRRVVEGVVRDHAATAALYSDSYLETRLQELDTVRSLSTESLASLDALLLPHVAGKPIAAFRIWKGDTIVYSEDRSLIGKSFSASPMRSKAAAGEVDAAYRLPDATGFAGDIQSRQPMLEVYAPIRKSGTNRIIAVAESYEIAPTLAGEIKSARLESWLLIGGVGLAMFLAQTAIVHGASGTIETQRAALANRVQELSRMLAENSTLRQARESGLRVTEKNEHFLRQIGADLHDGPIQIIAMSLLRLDALGHVLSEARSASSEEARQDIVIVRDALTDTLGELRNMAAGLTLPQLEKLPVPQLLRTAAGRHERLTGSVVACRLDESLLEAPLSLKVCLYRFVQEGLNNAFRHAGGRGQEIRTAVADGHLYVDIVDDGPTLLQEEEHKDHVGQGLIGLRDRVQSLGGRLQFRSLPCGGAKLSAVFQLALQSSNQAPSHD